MHALDFFLQHREMFYCGQTVNNDIIQSLMIESFCLWFIYRFSSRVSHISASFCSVSLRGNDTNIIWGNLKLRFETESFRKRLQLWCFWSSGGDLPTDSPSNSTRCWKKEDLLQASCLRLFGIQILLPHYHSVQPAAAHQRGLLEPEEDHRNDPHPSNLWKHEQKIQLINI